MYFRTATAALLAVTLLISCAAETSHIVQIKKDTYTLSYKVGISRAVNWVELKVEALQRASDYCRSLGQTMVRPQVDSNHATGLTPKEARVTFLCQPDQSNSPRKK